MGSKVCYHFPVDYAGGKRVEEVVVDGFADTKAELDEAFKRIRVIANIRLRANEVAFIGDPEVSMSLPLAETALL